MAYKKYIKRGGKIYGPYIYHSKRINGKVVSEYHGQDKKQNLKFLWIFLGVIFVLSAFYVFSDNTSITGKSILDVNAEYREGEPLQGKLMLSLNEGEFIPASSKVIFENQGSKYEYELKDLVTEEPSEGNFFIEGSFVSGAGGGYGIPGRRENHPVVYFTLSILSETQPQETGNESNETANENQGLEDNSAENMPAEENATSPGITDVIANFFLALTPTGNVVAEFEREVSGQVSAENGFAYELSEGETAEIKPKSVRLESGEQLNENEINFEIQGNQAIVTTEYSESGEGFGEEYAGNRTKEIAIDLSKLNLFLDKGELDIRLNYLGEDLIKLTTVLDDGNVIAEPAENETLNASEEQENQAVVFPGAELTAEERQVLEAEFGNISLEVEEATLRNGLLTVRYGLGDYWIEYTYDNSLNKSVLEPLMEADRIKWLKDLVKSISRNETQSESVEFPKNFSV